MQRSLEQRLERLERLEDARAPQRPTITAVIVWLPGGDPSTLRTGTVFVRGRMVPYRELIPPLCPSVDEEGRQ